MFFAHYAQPHLPLFLSEEKCIDDLSHLSRSLLHILIPLTFYTYSCFLHLHRHSLDRVETAIERVTIEQVKTTQSLATLVNILALEHQTSNPSRLEVSSQDGSTSCTLRCPIKVGEPTQTSRISEKPSKMTRQKPQSTKTPQVGQALQVFTQKSLARCKEWCSCSCHDRNAVKVKDRSTIGSFSLIYSGLPWFNPDCDQKSCRSRSVPSVSVTFQFPSWFWKRHLSTSLSCSSIQGPDISLRLPRVVDWYSNLWAYGVSGDIGGIQRLYSSRLASPWDVNPLGGSLLHYATDHGHWDLCRFLVDQRMAIDTEDDFNNSPAAIVWGKILSGKLTDNEVSRMAGAFSETDFLETRRFTILHKIVLHLIPRTLESELAFSTKDLDAVDSNGRTCVSWAAARGDDGALRILLEYDADVKICDGQGSSPLHHASTVACIDLLIRSGAHINARNTFGHTPLHSLCRESVASLDRLERLVEIGVDINATDKNGETALANAIFNRHASCALYLLDRGVDLDGVNDSEDAPIHLAIMQNMHDAIRQLLKRGAQYTRPNVIGYTVLHHAAKLGDSATVAILKQHGLVTIDVSHLDREGKSARDLLQERELDSESPDFGVRFEGLLRGIVEAQGMKSGCQGELEGLDLNLTSRLAGLGLKKDVTVTTYTPVSSDDEEDLEDEDCEHNPPVFFDAVEEVHGMSTAVEIVV